MEIIEEEFPMILDFYYSLQILKLVDMYCRERKQLPNLPHWSLQYDWNNGYGYTTETFLFKLLENNFGIKLFINEGNSTLLKDTELKNLEREVNQLDESITFEDYDFIWIFKTPYKFPLSHETNVEGSAHGYRDENETSVIYYDSYIIVACEYGEPESVGVCKSILEKLKEVSP
ncbi:hypothetical protein ACQKMI_24325 [Lysinibacillus sp. NPDC097214]|uniref:hypothetical protein n=1 Tax=Lysinibacillus sp. NPDC097214 TaxID=3390584 RepID=UPI003D072ECB